MAKLRSPNYPNRNLESTLGLAQQIYTKDGRNKISRAVVAQHLGHEGITGPALGKIGALRAYGILEGGGDELRISEDAVAALMAPLGSDVRKEAIRRLAGKPTLFQDIRKEFPGKVSIESLSYWLIQNGFQQKAAPIASRVYFDTVEFSGGMETGFDSPPSSLDYGNSPPSPAAAEGMFQTKADISSVDGERVLTTGMLSKMASFRLLVTGAVGPKEIDRLIAKLQLDKEILADTEDSASNLDDLLG